MIQEEPNEPTPPPSSVEGGDLESDDDLRVPHGARSVQSEPRTEYSAAAADAGVIDYDYQRRAVLAVAAVLLVFSVIEIAVLRGMHHIASLIACILLITATRTPEVFRNAGHPRHCYNRACALSVGFVCCAFTAAIDCVALFYSMIENALGNQEHVPTHYKVYVLVTCWTLALELGMLSAVHQLQAKVQEEAQANPRLCEEGGRTGGEFSGDRDLDAHNEVNEGVDEV
eukprot:TRINITY_DN32626_c0_g1_i1.p1 TRINITY_DN32626_c0_g1~~TRINITY_DN32626_c0_g1_i1.p1  ORF type:complete len:228 (+),score=66.41 TRINITY_DN32626_c0_g1_i1:75-758(+)